MMLIFNSKLNHKSLFQVLILLLISRHSAMTLLAVERALHHNCKVPQPRAYHLKDLMQSQNLLLDSREAPDTPAYLVVQRCDGHAGCCFSPDLICKPDPTIDSIREEELEIDFLSVNLTGTSATKRKIRKKIRVEQHYNCSCEAASQIDRILMEKELPRITIVNS